MSEEEKEIVKPKEKNSDGFDYKILTTEAKISLIFQMLTDLETDLYGMQLQEPRVEDPNYVEWEYNVKTTIRDIAKMREKFDELGGNYDFNRMKKSD